MFKNLIIFCYGINLSLFSMEDNHHSFSNVFQPIELETTEYFDDIKQKLCKYDDKFKLAFQFDDKNHTIMIFLPLPLVQAIMLECGYDFFYKDKHFNFSYKLSTKSISCTFPFSDLLYKETLAAKYNNDHIEPKIINIIDIPEDNKSDHGFHILFNFLFEKYHGVIIGEAHNDFSARYTLCLLMTYFSEIGIKKIYVEFIPIQLQNIIDNYMDANTYEMPDILSSYLDFITHNTPNNIKHFNEFTYKKIVELAKKHNIKIYGIDDEKFLSLANVDNNHTARIVTMNQLAKKCYDNNNKDEKCIIFCGQLHATTCISDDNKNIWGIRELLGLPSIYIRSSLAKDMNDNKETEMCINSNPKFITRNRVTRLQANFDIYFKF